MPSNTPTGLPYPLATEPVADGAAAIQSLATAIDPRLPRRILTNTHDVTVPANQPAGTLHVNFPSAFAGTPRVFTNIARNGPPRAFTSRAQAITTTGFDLWCGNATGATLASETVIGVDWFAIYM